MQLRLSCDPYPHVPYISLLNVDASGAVLNEHLRKLHGGGDAAMAGVRIRDDGVHVVLGCVIMPRTTCMLL